MFLVNRPLAEIQAKVSDAAQSKIEAVFPNWFVYKKHGNMFARYPSMRYANNSANVEIGYCAAEKAVWLAATDTAVSSRDLLLVWKLALIEHELSNTVDRTVNRCYKQLDNINNDKVL